MKKSSTSLQVKATFSQKRSIIHKLILQTEILKNVSCKPLKSTKVQLLMWLCQHHNHYSNISLCLQPRSRHLYYYDKKITWHNQKCKHTCYDLNQHGQCKIPYKTKPQELQLPNYLDKIKHTNSFSYFNRVRKQSRSLCFTFPTS